MSAKPAPIDWLARFDDRQRHAHTLQAIALRNRRVQRVCARAVQQAARREA